MRGRGSGRGRGRGTGTGRGRGRGRVYRCERVSSRIRPASACTRSQRRKPAARKRTERMLRLRPRPRPRPRRRPRRRPSTHTCLFLPALSPQVTRHRVERLLHEGVAEHADDGTARQRVEHAAKRCLRDVGVRLETRQPRGCRHNPRGGCCGRYVLRRRAVRVRVDERIQHAVRARPRCGRCGKLGPRGPPSAVDPSPSVPGRSGGGGTDQVRRRRARCARWALEEGQSQQRERGGGEEAPARTHASRGVGAAAMGRASSG